MKIQEFAKYKRLVESRDPELLQGNEKAMKVYSWMEESGRIDEGFWGAIWGWLKRNFSTKAMKIHKLADEFGVEIKKEMEAEFAKQEDPKDKAAKMRVSWAGKISGDIRERMDIEAGDDNDYRELVRHLANKKTLEAKKFCLKYLDEEYATVEKRKIGKAEKENEKALKRTYSSLTADDRNTVDEMRTFLRKEIERYKSTFSKAFSKSESEDFIKSLSVYMFKLAQKYPKKTKYDEKFASQTLREIEKFIRESADKLKSSKYSVEDIIKAVFDSLKNLMDNSENPLEMPSLKKQATEDAKDTLEKSEEDEESTEKEVEKEVKKATTSPYTSVEMSPEEVKDSIEDAKEKTGEEEPSAKEVVDEIRSEVEDVFQSSNLPVYVSSINTKVEKFNNLKDDQRTEAAKEYDYDLTADFKLKDASQDDVKNMIPVFIDIVGAIVPYYASIKEDRNKTVIAIVKRYMFEIYAMKKDHTQKLSTAQKDKLIANIREKYS